MGPDRRGGTRTSVLVPNCARIRRTTRLASICARKSRGGVASAAASLCYESRSRGRQGRGAGGRSAGAGWWFVGGLCRGAAGVRLCCEKGLIDGDGLEGSWFLDG